MYLIDVHEVETLNDGRTEVRTDVMRFNPSVRIEFPDTDGNVIAPMSTYHTYVDNDPIPQIWFQMQPQLQGLTSGTANVLAQVQFEVRIDYDLCGQCPSIAEIAEVAGSDTAGLPNQRQYMQDWALNNAAFMPLFRPIMRTNLARNWNDDEGGCIPASMSMVPASLRGKRNIKRKRRNIDFVMNGIDTMVNQLVDKKLASITKELRSAADKVSAVKKRRTVNK